jgi:proline iminopeptidase
MPQHVPFADARELSVAVGGTALYVRSIGKGPTVIVLHGGPDFDHSYLLPALDRLSDAFHLIYYDQRGRGKSADHVQPHDVSLASDVDDLDVLRQHFGLKSAIVLGHSWGAVLAMEYACRHPDRVSHLILMNPAPAASHDAAVFRQAYLRKLGAEAARQSAVVASAAYQAGDPTATMERYRIHFKPALARPEDYETLMTQMSAMFIQHGSDGILKARAVEDRLMRDTWEMPDYDVVRRLSHLRIPALVITGDRDVIPTEVAERIARGMANATFIAIADCGHFTYLERGDAFRHAVDTFVDNGCRS